RIPWRGCPAARHRVRIPAAAGGEAADRHGLKRREAHARLERVRRLAVRKRCSMSGSTLGTLFCVTTFGESHGPAIGCVVDGCPPGLELSEADIQPDLDPRRPGTSRHVTQRKEEDKVEILSGVFEGRTTGTPIALLIRNTDQRSK